MSPDQASPDSHHLCQEAALFPKAADPRFGSIYQAFEASARCHAHRIAMIGDSQTLSFRQMEEIAARVHGVLESNRIPRATGVGLMFADPFRLIPAILGVLRAGSYYVCLDPDSPEARLTEIVADGAITVILAAPDLCAAARSLSAAMPVIVFPECDDPAGPLPFVAPSVVVEPHELAYIAYTSGSTGVPKGVMHAHANVLHEVAVHRRSLNLEPDDRSTLLYSPAVTGCVRDLFTMLLTGGRLCPFPFRQRGFTELKTWLRTQAVTQLHAVPGVFRELIRAMEPDERLESVRTVFVAGERVLPNDVRQFRRHFSPTARFYTGIGATETSSIYTHWFVDDNTAWPEGRLPSGWPVPDKEVRLVGDDRQPVAQGEKGEIAVCSRYLAQGYWRRPLLDKMNFSDLNDGSGRRIYYTGDYGYFDAQDRLVHLGRRDRQLKINGLRIELSGIEHLLCSQPGITAAAVTVMLQNTMRPRIVAYVVAPAGIDIADLRARLSGHLESVAMPARIVLLDALPLAGNGKVDYHALASLDYAGAPRAADAPSEDWSPEERQVLEIWRSVFPGLPSYSRDETFAALGGDSLGALRLAELLKQRLRLELPVGRSVCLETVASLAERVGAMSRFRRSADTLEDKIDELASLGELWRLPESARQLAPDCPVFLAGEHQPGVPLVWFGLVRAGLEIGLEIARHRPVYLIPSAASAGVDAMDQICRELAARVAPWLPGHVMCGGCCYSGLQAMVLARALKSRGLEIDTVFLLDVFGSTRSRLLALKAFHTQWRLRLRQPVLPKKAFGKLWNFVRRWNQAVAPKGIPQEETYLINFVPFGYDGRIVNILSARTAWLRWIMPRLGWGAVEHANAELHIVPGDHNSNLKPPGLNHVVSLIEKLAACADTGQSAAPPALTEPLETISDTARWVAVYRAWETSRPDAVFRDPFAERLAGTQGERIVRKLGATWMASSIVVRTAVIDDFVRDAIAGGVDTVLNLAAGLDTRPYRMKLPQALHWFEVDLPAILKYKESILAGETPQCRLTRIAQDLSDATTRRNLFAGIAAQGNRILVITEGLLVYLPESEVALLAADLAAHKNFTYWAQDFIAPDVLISLNRSWGSVLGHARAPMVFAPAEAAEYYRPYGWNPKNVRYFTGEARRLNRDGLFPPAEEQRGKDSGYVLLERASSSAAESSSSAEQNASTCSAGVW